MTRRWRPGRAARSQPASERPSPRSRRYPIPWFSHLAGPSSIRVAIHDAPPSRSATPRSGSVRVAGRAPATLVAHESGQDMNRRTMLAGAAAAGTAVFVGRRRMRRSPQPIPRITPAEARPLVEAALGQRARRSQLTLDFEPAIATRWDLLIDGASFF